MEVFEGCASLSSENGVPDDNSAGDRWHREAILRFVAPQLGAALDVGFLDEERVAVYLRETIGFRWAVVAGAVEISLADAPRIPVDALGPALADLLDELDELDDYAAELDDGATDTDADADADAAEPPELSEAPTAALAVVDARAVTDARPVADAPRLGATRVPGATPPAAECVDATEVWDWPAACGTVEARADADADGLDPLGARNPGAVNDAAGGPADEVGDAARTRARRRPRRRKHRHRTRTQPRDVTALTRPVVPSCRRPARGVGRALRRPGRGPPHGVGTRSPPTDRGRAGEPAAAHLLARPREEFVSALVSTALAAALAGRHVAGRRPRTDTGSAE